MGTRLGELKNLEKENRQDEGTGHGVYILAVDVAFYRLGLLSLSAAGRWKTPGHSLLP